MVESIARNDIIKNRHSCCLLFPLYVIQEIFFIGDNIVKMDNKRPFRTSLKYDKEIKDEVETEGRELSDLSINLAQELLRKTIS